MPQGVKGFQKGRKKTGGKTKGCKHRINRDITGLLDKLKCNPIEGLARIAIDDKVDVGVRAHAFARLAKFIHPELKSVEVSGPGGSPIKVYAGDSAKQRLNARIARALERSGPQEVAG